MKRTAASLAILCFGLLAERSLHAQRAPLSYDRPWPVTPSAQTATATHTAKPALDATRTYTLSELVDIAEHNNPETRVAWENAKARAAALGVSKASLYPTVAAAVLAETVRSKILFYPAFVRDTLFSVAPALEVDYTIFDFGRRLDQIATNRESLLAANFQFNDTHRRIIFAVMSAYYRLLNSKGQEEAQEANLKNAETDQQAAEARLQAGLATLPDVLEARSAAAQADYDLQAAIGASEIAHGDLTTSLGISPASPLLVESIQALPIPQALSGSVESALDRALAQRPDLMQRVAQERGAAAALKGEKTAYVPTLRFEGSGGLNKTYGEQDQLPGLYSPNQEFWSAHLSLRWTLFDGFEREHRIAQARAEEKQASAEADAVRDQVENEVWTAYYQARTALRQQKAAAALLQAAQTSYRAAIESYNYGVRSQIDVVSAQRTLAVARTADVTARTQLLTGMAALAFQTGDLLHTKGP